MRTWEEQVAEFEANREEATPIFDQLYLEQRKSMFERIGFKFVGEQS